MRRMKNFGNWMVFSALVLTILFFQVVQASDKDIERLEEAFVSAVEKVRPAVVNISSAKRVKVVEFMPFDEDFWRFFFHDVPGEPWRRRPREREKEPETETHKRYSLGAGLILDAKNGYVLTNNHVIAGADEVTVTYTPENGRTHEYEAEVKGADEMFDIAVLQIEPDVPLPQAVLGDSAKLRVGQWVLAIGHPYGYPHTVTQGIVSAKGREISPHRRQFFEDYIQTSAAINRGNSGGPLVNLRGEVVGISTAITTPSGGFIGIGFAIPIDLVKEIKEDLIEHGKVFRGFLGILIENLDRDSAETLGLDRETGILVVEVQTGTPAEEAGMQRYDVIISYQGEEVSTVHQLRGLVGGTKPGTEVRLQVIRDGKEMTIPVKLGTAEPGEEGEVVGTATLWRGLSVRELTDSDRKRFDLGTDITGVAVANVETDSPAGKAGLQEGDIISELDRTPVESVRDFERIVKNIKQERSVFIYVENKGILVLKPDEE